MALNRGFRNYFDWPLFIAVVIIAVIGVVNLYSATSAPGARADIYIQQIYWLTLGAGVAVLIVAIDYRYFERHGWIAYGIGIVLLILVFLLGRNIRGSQRWIPIGGFSLQPSELMKIFLVIALAKYLHNDPKTDGRTLKDLVIPGLILMVPMGLILAQPDLGTAMICAFIFGTIMVLTNLRLRSLLTLAAAFVLSAPLTWTYLLRDYQRERLTAFLNPEAVLLDSGWHAHQSLVAIGSGRLVGKGFMQGTQNQFRFLPDQQTDFPFTVWAEEQGFVGTVVLIILYLFIVLWGLKIASQAKDRFGAVVAVVVALVFAYGSVVGGLGAGVVLVVVVRRRRIRPRILRLG